jgi:hypothetical protein
MKEHRRIKKLLSHEPERFGFRDFWRPALLIAAEWQPSSLCPKVDALLADS